MSEKTKHILFTRLDNLGDVICSLPLIGLVREHYPNAKITFLATAYTKALVSICPDIDQIWNWTELQILPNEEIIKKLQQAQITTVIHLSQSRHFAALAKKARIPLRVANLKGKENWLYCNRWVHLPNDRLGFHEAERTLKMLKPLGIRPKLSLSEIASYIHLTPHTPLPSPIEALLTTDRFNLILHPGSNGHGCEWSPDYFKQLIAELSENTENKFQIFLTGGPQEQERFKDLIESSPQAINLMGAMTLEEFLTFLSRVDGLVASGTGPLHVSAALGIKTLGLFPPKKGISLKRWSPLGKQAQAIVCPHTEPCRTCPGSRECLCMRKIPVKQVKDILQGWLNENAEY